MKNRIISVKGADIADAYRHEQATQSEYRITNRKLAMG